MNIVNTLHLFPEFFEKEYRQALKNQGSSPEELDRKRVKVPNSKVLFALIDNKTPYLIGAENLCSDLYSCLRVLEEYTTNYLRSNEQDN